MPRLFSATLLLLLASSSSLFADQQWVEVRSQHFTMITDAGEKRGREVLTRFEQMRASFGVIFNRGHANVNLPVPLEIVGFRSSKQMRDFGAVFNGKPVANTGFFQPGQDRNFIALDLSTDSGWEVVFHEYAHLIINANLPPLPLWFDEGFADFCSSFKVEGKEVAIGEALPGRAQTLLESRWLRLVDLFSVKHESRDYNEGDRRSVFYAESWLMVHYLIVTKQMDKVIRYMNLVQNQRVPVDEAIQQAFGMDAAHLEKELHKYFEGSAKYFHAPAPPDMDGKPFQSRILSPLETQAILADFHYHERDHHQQALAEFKQVLQQDPDNALANRVLGEAYLRQYDLPNARECFRRAAAQGSTDARVYYFGALLYQAGDQEESGADRWNQMATLLQKAVALDSAYAEAYNLLAFVRARQGDASAAIEMASKAAQLAPREEAYRVSLVGYLIEARQFDKAAPVIAALSNSSNPGIAAQARQWQISLAQMQQASTQTARPSAGDTPPAPHRESAADTPVQLSVRTREKQDASDVYEPPPGPVLPSQPIKFLKGNLVGVSCDSAPAAILTVTPAAGKPLSLRIADVNSMVLIGADKFSCTWRNKRVAVNYREGGAQLTVVSLEVQ